MAVKEITDRLNGYEFDLITARQDRKFPRQEKIGRVNVYRLGVGWPKFDKFYLALFGHLKGLVLHRQKEYSRVWAIMASFGGFAALSFKLKTNLPYLLTMQEGDPLEEIKAKVRAVKSRFKKIFSQADGLQAISQYLFNWGKEMGFTGRVKEVVPNGVDVANFTKTYPVEELLKLRHEWGFPDNAVIMVTASRLVIKNGLADVIKAMVKLPVNVCFYICGDGPLKNQLEKLVQDFGLSTRVRFGGLRGHEQLPKIFKASDIFIRPSLSEGLGNAFLEAMAAGLPTIGTPVGGIPDFLTDGVTGLVCEPGNVESIVMAVNRAMALSPEAKSKLRDNALALIEKKYNWEYIAGRMDEIFIRLLA